MHKGCLVPRSIRPTPGGSSEAAPARRGLVGSALASGNTLASPSAGAEVSLRKQAEGLERLSDAAHAQRERAHTHRRT
jgi:hypothetical protein